MGTDDVADVIDALDAEGVFHGEHADEDRALARELLEMGAAAEELRQAVATNTLPELAIQSNFRRAGPTRPFAEAVTAAGGDPDATARVWQALGHSPGPEARVTDRDAELLVEVTSFLGGTVGEEATIRLTRVIGSSMARIAAAIVETLRVNFEMPQVSAGAGRLDLVHAYGDLLATFPPLGETLETILLGHVFAFAREEWAQDVSVAAVTADRVVGFVDIAGYTQASRRLSPSRLAALVGDFEHRVGSAVGEAGGHVVKSIGDEVMFVAVDPAAGCRAATELAAIRVAGELPLRVGLAYGRVLSVQGDYYGEPVNLAARLVAVADPGSAVLSAPVVEAAGAEQACEPLEPVSLKGFDEPVAVYAITP